MIERVRASLEKAGGRGREVVRFGFVFEIEPMNVLIKGIEGRGGRRGSPREILLITYLYGMCVFNA